MIICGFAGIGKSFLATNGNRWVDLESTPFRKNWDLYSDVAIHMDKNGYDVMLSCHKPLRDILIEKGAYFYVSALVSKIKTNTLKDMLIEATHKNL